MFTQKKKCLPVECSEWPGSKMQVETKHYLLETQAQRKMTKMCLTESLNHIGNFGIYSHPVPKVEGCSSRLEKSFAKSQKSIRRDLS